MNITKPTNMKAMSIIMDITTGIIIMGTLKI
jgi:hypothetical protein